MKSVFLTLFIAVSANSTEGKPWTCWARGYNPATGVSQTVFGDKQPTQDQAADSALRACMTNPLTGCAINGCWNF